MTTLAKDILDHLAVVHIDRQSTFLLREARVALIQQQEEIDKLKALLRGPGVRRAAFCLRCGHAVPYTEGDEASQKAAFVIMSRHEDECPKNPLVAKVATLRAALQECHKLLRDMYDWDEMTESAAALEQQVREALEDR